MVNKLFKKSAFIKNIRLIHVLLIILIMVVFFGLFKKEINSFRSEIALNMPNITDKEIHFDKPCETDNFYKSALFQKLSSQCGNYISNKDRQGYFNEFSSKTIQQCKILEKQGDNCCKRIVEYNSLPNRVNGTCLGVKYEKWFRVFGKDWFKIK